MHQSIVARNLVPLHVDLHRPVLPGFVRRYGLSAENARLPPIGGIHANHASGIFVGGHRGSQQIRRLFTWKAAVVQPALPGYVVWINSRDGFTVFHQLRSTMAHGGPHLRQVVNREINQRRTGVILDPEPVAGWLPGGQDVAITQTLWKAFKERSARVLFARRTLHNDRKAPHHAA